MKYLIVDDEPIAHRIIEGYCAELPHLEKVGNAYNAFEAASIVSKQAVDLIFLDINMPKMTGFEWLKTLTQPPNIVVTTAYKEYAIEGYELNIVDYLLKPFSFPRFLQAINKATEVRSTSVRQPLVNQDIATQRFFLKGDKKYHQVNSTDILFVEAFGNYCKVYMITAMLLTHEKISSLESLLPTAAFMRVHKSFLVAIDKIQSIEGNLIHIQGHNIPIGQTYRRGVSRLLGKK
ncbi:MAG: LytTR family DNA-binding domain-containing protein [Bacteroidota bacterium]